MPLAEKEKKQVMALGLVLVVIVGVMAYVYRDKWLPSPQGESAISVLKRSLELKGGELDFSELFERNDYKSLTEFGRVPVVPMRKGAENPFKIEEELLP